MASDKVDSRGEEVVTEAVAPVVTIVDVDLTSPAPKEFDYVIAKGERVTPQVATAFVDQYGKRIEAFITKLKNSLKDLQGFSYVAVTADALQFWSNFEPYWRGQSDEDIPVATFSFETSDLTYVGTVHLNFNDEKLYCYDVDFSKFE